MRSGGLHWDGICLHEADAISTWMTATLFPSNIFHLFGGPCIHVSTMEKFIHSWTHFLLYWVRLWLSCTDWTTMWLHKFPILVWLIVSVVTHLMWNTEVHKMSSCYCLWSACRGTLHCLVHCCQKSMYFYVDSIRADNLPGYLRLWQFRNSLQQQIPFLLQMSWK